ncbi:Uncharacterised protein [Mycobacteroides abscessus]|nr:Uncharacterised protein [Mycobacteroides abscessus]
MHRHFGQAQEWIDFCSSAIAFQLRHFSFQLINLVMQRLGILRTHPAGYRIALQHLRHVKTHCHFQIAQATVSKDLIHFLL